MDIKIRRIAPPSARKDRAPFGMAEVRFEGGPLSQHVRVRECGDYAWGAFQDQSYPALHSIVSIDREFTARRFAIDIEEVTNSQFQTFLTQSGYRPRQSEGLVRHLHGKDGNELAKVKDRPVTHVDLDDARAYAKWIGKRLPTEWEWTMAAHAEAIHRGSPLVWNLTESEHTDTRTDFVMLKGGCDWQAVGSGWYADGGHQEPEFVAKFIRIWPGLDRCATIGFRCALDL